MPNRRSSLCFLALAVGLLILSAPCRAAEVGQPCDNVGKTTPSSDQHSLLACLYDSDNKPVWEQTNLDGGNNGAAKTTSKWQGWYAGIAAGLADTSSSYNSYSYLPAPYNANESLQSYGGLAGLVGGYNVVTRSGFFYGAEGDVTNPTHKYVSL